MAAESGCRSDLFWFHFNREREDDSLTHVPLSECVQAPTLPNRLGGKEEVKCDSPRAALAQVSPRFQDHVEEMTPATRAVDENLPWL